MKSHFALWALPLLGLASWAPLTATGQEPAPGKRTSETAALPKSKKPPRFPAHWGKYHLVLLGVGENDGEATHEVLVNDESVLTFQIPLSTEKFETGKKFNKIARNIEFGQGDVITLKSKVASADGKQFSRARLAGLVFIPADDATRADVAQMETASPSTPKSALPHLQQPRQPDGDGSAAITGANTQWQPVTLSIEGPFVGLDRGRPHLEKRQRQRQRPHRSAELALWKRHERLLLPPL